MKNPISGAIKSIQSLKSPEIRKLVWISLLATLMLLLVFVGGVQWILLEITLFETGWLDWLVDALGGIGTLFVAWLLFPVLMPFIAQLFDERIAATIERESGLPQPANPLDARMADFLYDMRFLVISLTLNLLLLILLIVPPLYLAGYFLLNGYLMGREFFAIVGGRHLGRPAANALRRKHRTRIWLAGAVIAGVMIIPFANLFAPVFGIAMMVYMFHGVEEHDTVPSSII